MTLTPEQFNKLVTKDEFNVLKDDALEIKNYIRTMLGMLEKNAKNDDDHAIEHVSNITAHDRFQRDIDQIKTQVKASANA